MCAVRCGTRADYSDVDLSRNGGCIAPVCRGWSPGTDEADQPKTPDFGFKEVTKMTEQQKVTELYEQLPPEKKAVFLMMVRMVGNMMTALVALTTEQKGATK